MSNGMAPMRSYSEFVAEEREREARLEELNSEVESPEFRPDRSRPARLTYSEHYGHACTIHGPRPMRVNRNVEPTETGSYYYSCSVCGAGGWSGC